jgi:hypothetical protein
MAQNILGNPVMNIMILLIINAINGVAAAVVGLILWDNALSAVGLILAIAALIVAFNIRSLRMDMWTYAVVLNIIGIVLYLFTFLEFMIIGIVLCVLTLVLLNLPSVRAQFK